MRPGRCYPRNVILAAYYLPLNAASMRPGRLLLGNASTASYPAPTWRCFNEAGAVPPRKWATAPLTMAYGAPLQ